MKFPKPVLASLMGFLIMLTGCHREAPSPAPENVTLLIEDENRILTLGFSEYLAGCIFAAADPSFQEETLLAAGIALSSQAQYCMQNCEADFGADLADRWRNATPTSILSGWSAFPELRSARLRSASIITMDRRTHLAAGYPPA